jgi:Family of unknown function (DUF5690)
VANGISTASAGLIWEIRCIAPVIYFSQPAAFFPFDRKVPAKHFPVQHSAIDLSYPRTMRSMWIDKLRRNPAWAMAAAFGTYFCMYGFRKPYTAATYADASFLGMEFKFLLVISQTLGYVLAKWIGIKVVSEVKRGQRLYMLAGLLAIAESMLLCFGFIPRPWNAFCLFVNGLCLGLVFGLILGFLEGKRNTEMLIAGLCASFIVSDGVSKSVGTWLLQSGVAEDWMPVIAGALFALPTVFFVLMLRFVPTPTDSDMASRTLRVPMYGKDRADFFLKYAPGLVGITVVYLLITLLRSVRADFAPELWTGLGYPQTPALFTQSELWVSLGVICINALAIFIVNHRRAFRFSLFICLGGFVLLLFSLLGLRAGLGKFPFMVLIGLGVYLPYVAIHTTVFERLIAFTRERANIGFLMYVVDSVGYSGYIALILLRHAMPSSDSILVLFVRMVFFLGVGGMVTVLFCHWYFHTKFKAHERQIAQLAPG